jgi:carbon-monoxide dehydrogenase medium subunit
VLAGGQSLLASLNLRLSAPSLLVDITALPGLSNMRVADGALHIGALVTHRAIEQSELVAKHVPLLAQAAPHIAHVAIRNAGTLGGSLALADPAAEWPACCLALDARIVLASAKGERRVAAGEFFKGLYTTALAPGEIVAAAEFPLPGSQARSAFLELVRRRGDYAIVGLAAQRNGAGLRLAFFGVGATPVLAKNAAAAPSLEKALEALPKDLDPPADLYHSAATKLHLAKVLLSRTWNTLSTPR